MNIPNKSKLEIYYEKISKTIREKMKEKDISQKKLVEECNSKFGINIAQSSISKMLSVKDTMRMSLDTVVAICEILKIDLTETLSFAGVFYDKNEQVFSKAYESNSTDEYDHSTMITAPTHPAFNGYVDNEFEIFMFPTISNENGMLSGILKFENDRDQSCTAKIILYTSSWKGNKSQKEYTGQLWISLQQNACYCTVTSHKLSEICSIVFYHRFFTIDSMKVRLAAVATVSAGDSRRPTMHRMVICQKGIIDSEDKKRYISSHLLMNSSKLIIAESKLDELCKNENLSEIMEIIKDRASNNSKEEKYYLINESDILKIPDFSSSDLANALCELRLNSVSNHYNKIGAKADENLFNYLFKS